MIARPIAAIALMMAAACSREAPVENKPAATAVAPSPAAAAPAMNTVNIATIVPGPELPKTEEPEQATAKVDAEDEPTPGNAEETAEVADDEPAPPPLRGCAREIGERPAQRLVRQCILVSTASRPPCNVENSCALIRSEIRRGCGAVGDGEDAPRFCR